jgi:aspartate-semialdehyde dehydrogenase
MNVAIVGATGAVGVELLRLMEERDFPVRAIRLFASPRSMGREIVFDGKSYVSQVLEPGCFLGVDLVFLDASDEISRQWVPEALSAGLTVIDNSGAFRMNPEVPLVVPEINGAQALESQSRLYAGPNCAAVGMLLPLKAIERRWGLSRVVASTYQSVSGAGQAALTELRQETQNLLEGKAPAHRAFSQPIPFNCIPQIGRFLPDGFTSEEKKIIDESRKILALPALRMTVTSVRVPTERGHGAVVNVETEKSFALEDVASALASFPGVHYMGSDELPTNLVASQRDPVHVGRLRRDPSHPQGLQFWCISDNLRKGAATNAIQIAELLRSNDRL